LELLLAIVVSFFCVYAAHQLAVRKRRSRMGWMWATALLGPIPVVLLVCFPPGFHRNKTT
jgi:heme/copper-type cytochrome/quinol oxidase subunit 3